MVKSNAQARWEGNFKRGKGTVKLGSSGFEGEYSAASRFETGEGTNPEQLIGAAHASCFSMAFALALSEAGFEPESVDTEAEVTVDRQESGGFRITTSKLTTRAKVPGIDQDEFMKHANAAKEGCPVSQALAGVDISLDAQLVD